MDERCKHGLKIGTCSLCLGYKQSNDGKVKSGSSFPKWWRSSLQFSVGINYSFMKGRRYEEGVGEFPIPKGSEYNKLLPSFRKKIGKDTKARRKNV